MWKRFRFALAALLSLCAAGHAWAADAARTAAAPIASLDQAAVRAEFIAAMQRIRLHVPEPPDSPALEAYVIHDYLLAARLRRDLELTPSEEVDAAIDTFVQAHAKQPVARGLRHDWLASLAGRRRGGWVLPGAGGLAERRRWDWLLPRATDVVDPVLICDRLEGRLESGDTQGLGAAALTRWNLPQKQPRECDGVVAWLRTQSLVTPALAEIRARAAQESRGSCAGGHPCARSARGRESAAGARIRH